MAIDIKELGNRFHLNANPATCYFCSLEQITHTLSFLIHETGMTTHAHLAKNNCFESSVRISQWI